MEILSRESSFSPPSPMSNRTTPAAKPTRRPSRTFCSSTGSRKTKRARRPAKCSNSLGLVSFRLSPGEETSILGGVGPTSGAGDGRARRHRVCPRKSAVADLSARPSIRRQSASALRTSPLAQPSVESYRDQSFPARSRDSLDRRRLLLSQVSRGTAIKDKRQRSPRSRGVPPLFSSKLVPLIRS